MITSKFPILRHLQSDS